VVEHDARLDILSCLADGGALAVEQVSGRTGKHPPWATYHLRILDKFGLVGRERNSECGQTLYVERLDEHPPWVAAAVNAHRADD
jgi:DNA-binding transcriptional ArsR family regulator